MHRLLGAQVKPASPRRVPASAGGFSLIEIVTTTAIVSILAAVAVPSLREIIQRNRVAGEVNSFVGDLRYARS